LAGPLPGFDAQKFLAGDQQASVGSQSIVHSRPWSGSHGINPRRAIAHDGASAVEIDRHNLACAPVGKTEPAVVPAGRLDHGKALQEHRGLNEIQHLECERVTGKSKATSANVATR
jgi:hypothetical protein